MQLNGTPEQVISSRPPEFRLFLQEELVRRCKRNPRFSLRAFARTLDVEASALSKILNGKRSLTPKMLHRMCTQLGIAPDEVNRYEQTLSTARTTRRRPLRNDDDFEPVGADEFTAISDWYHYAILELMSVDGFKPQSSWIARALGLSVSEVNFAIERLVRLGLLEVTPDGNWRQQAGQLTTSASSFTTAAFRKLQRQILQQAVDALETVPLSERDQSSMTMAISKAKLAGAKERIRQFRRELCAYLQDSPLHDEVYQLSISLFPVSRVKGALTTAPVPEEGVLS